MLSNIANVPEIMSARDSGINRYNPSGSDVLLDLG